MHHEDIAVDVVPVWWCCSHVGELAGVIADVAGGSGEEEVGAAGILVKAGGIGVQVEHRPVPVASGCGSVGIETGEDEALGFRRKSTPGELWGDVVSVVGVKDGHGFAVDEVGACQGERRELGEKVVGVWCHRSCEIHITMVGDLWKWCGTGALRL